MAEKTTKGMEKPMIYNSMKIPAWFGSVTLIVRTEASTGPIQGVQPAAKVSPIKKAPMTPPVPLCFSVKLNLNVFIKKLGLRIPSIKLPQKISSTPPTLRIHI